MMPHLWSVSWWYVPMLVVGVGAILWRHGMAPRYRWTMFLGSLLLLASVYLVGFIVGVLRI